MVCSCELLIFPIRLQVELKQHFTGLRERLMIAMVPLRCEGCVMREEDLEGVEGVGGLQRVTQSIYKCIEQLCKASKPKEVSSKLLLVVYEQ